MVGKPSLSRVYAGKGQYFIVRKYPLKGAFKEVGVIW